VKSEAKSMLIIVFEILLFSKNSSWQAKQSIPHTTVMFYDKCVKNSTSKMHLKKWQKHWERCIRAEGDYFEGDGDK
jgi:hypothetical protein